jgi:hypothetical protein
MARAWLGKCSLHYISAGAQMLMPGTCLIGTCTRSASIICDINSLSGRWSLISSVVVVSVMMRQVIWFGVLLGLTAAAPPAAGAGNGDGDGDGAGRRETIRQATGNIFPVSFAASPTSSGLFQSAPVMDASASVGSPLPESSAGSQNGAQGLPLLANVVNVWSKMATTFYDHKRKV